MEEIQAPKKERKFLKAVVNIAKVLANELVMGIARKFIGKAIDKVGNKRQGLVIASVIFASTFAFAQYPATSNKQRLGYQTTGDGLLFRGRANDTMALKSSGLNNAYFILDTVNNVLFNYIKTKGGWVFNNTDTVINNITVDTTSLNNRINLKLNISDTASMLAPYFKDADTTSLNLTSRFAAKLNISDTASMLTNYLRSGVASLTYTPLARSISTTNPLQGGGDLSTDRTLSILSASETQSGILNTTAQLIGGSKVFKHRLTADSLFFLNNTSPIPTAILGINLTGGVNSVGKFTLGNGLSINSSTLLADTNLLVTRFDTASMLIPYFKNADTTSLNLTSRFALKLNISDTASMLTNYLRTGIAALTYLPLTGGTLSGAFGVNAATVLNGIGGDNDTRIESDNNPNMFFVDASENKVGIGTNTPSSTLSVNGSIGVNGGAVINGTGGDSDTKIESDNIEFMFFVDASENKVGIGTNTPSSTLTVNGTLGVTGATTLSSPLTVNSSAVFNEGSTDSDFRVESDGNVNMVFVDASTDRVGIGTNTPSKTLEVSGTFNATGDITEGGLNVLTSADTASLSSRINGKVSLTGDEYINGQKTFGGLIIPSNGMQLTATGNNSNKLIGINASSFVGEVTLGTGLSLTSNVLNASGTDTSSLSNRINLKYDKTGGTISGAVTLSTTTATPTALLGKDGSNVVGAVTTLAQTGLMTRGETTATTGSPSAIFTVTHGLGSTPTSVLITSAGIAGAEKIIFEVYAKDSTTFSVQAWNLNGTEAASKSVKIYWLAIK